MNYFFFVLIFPFILISALIHLLEIKLKKSSLGEHKRLIVLRGAYLSASLLMLFVLLYFLFFSKNDMASLIIFLAAFDVFFYFGKYVKLPRF